MFSLSSADSAITLKVFYSMGALQALRQIVITDLSSWQDGKTAAHVAAMNGHMDCLEAIMEHGVDVNRAPQVRKVREQIMVHGFAVIVCMPAGGSWENRANIIGALGLIMR